ncbi:protein RGF1 INDUCIBLE TRANSCRIPTION FACTOR 1-like [Zingiber officinale]|uniref:protein RGF1 INDUCIBLE TRANSCRIPTION FACTOR 1-like n=1 Tax=Zingiber officinale TaxID=94328 RepID=UPI001C4BDFA5|nr:protein RGF1 INDUCIBLE TRANSCRIPTION FACTOR 1-like [Zingiber officinale]
MGRREFGAGIPRWLCGLVEESFFVGCPAHENRKKNEKNTFCLGCCTSICLHCAADHRSHPLLQVRRYIYNDVVRLEELDKLIDCSYVQPYTINSAKVVFLKPRPRSRPSKGSANICSTCDRILQEPFHFCSLSCKVDHFLVVGEDLSSILVEESEIAFSHFESLRVDSSDPLEDYSQMTVEEEPMHDSDYGRKSSGTKKESGGSFPNQALSPSFNNSGRRRRKSQNPQRSYLS